jgi:predicted DNA repair protein MutK
MGRSRGGLTSKIHAVVDSNGLPVRLALSPGEAHDVRLAGKLLSRVLAKLAAASLDDAVGQAVKVSGKAAGVVIDDAAVTPRYVVGFASERELPIIRRIARGSLKNKILVLLPAALFLSAFVPWVITPLLMIGGLFLCFEGYEKVHQIIGLPDTHANEVTRASPTLDPSKLEEKTVAGAIRTDFILSAEIMAISLAALTATPSILMQAVVLLIVSLLVTVGVYGVVAIIVKVDDFGVYLAQRGGTITRAVGQVAVQGMPPFLKTLSFVGTLAMLWVGGSIIIHGLHAYRIDGPENVVDFISDAARTAFPLIGGWLAAALSSAVFGLAMGAISALMVVPVLTLLWRTVSVVTARH